VEEYTTNYKKFKNMSVSTISDKNKYLLWVRAGGNCQYEGCNHDLSQDIITKRNFNSAYIAHIVADVATGPRGCPTRSPLLGDDISNLMLLCDTHHRLIDKVDVVGHPEDRLIRMKQIHEERIRRLTAMAPSMHSHMVIYKANVGQHTPVLTYEALRDHLLPSHYPAQDRVIDLSLTNSPQRDKDAAFWQTETDVLDKHYNEKLKPQIQGQEISHLSLFAFAPIPLLIKLGVLLNDIQNIRVHQPIRNPKTWRLSANKNQIEYKVSEVLKNSTNVALNFSLSATISDDRIYSVLGDEANIYTLTIPTPFNDYLQNEVHLEDFNIQIRYLLDKIKAKHGKVPLHIFPAMPIATAIEFGRVWMPKADMPLHLYDENTAIGGFIKVIEISNN
jgi:hypothetical protein